MSYSLNPVFEIVEAEGGGIALDKKNGKYLQLNVMGYRVLQSMIEGRTQDEIRADLTDDYPEQEHRIADDLRVLEQELLAKGVVTWTGL